VTKKIATMESASKSLVDAFKEAYSPELVKAGVPKLKKKSSKQIMNEQAERISELQSALNYSKKALCDLLTHDNLQSIRMAQEAVVMAEVALRGY